LKKWFVAGGAGCALAVGLTFVASPVRAQIAPDSLKLQQPNNFTVWSEFQPVLRRFIVWMTWDDPSDSVATFVHQPDTTGWRVNTPAAQLALPSTRGPYTGDKDRRISFRALDQGTVGQAAPLHISYSVRGEEYLTGILDVGSAYVPGTYVTLLFDDQRTVGNEQLDFGLSVAMSPGIVDQQGGFNIAVEDFEGFHIWRGLRKDGSDLEIVGEISKEEAFLGRRTGGSLPDSLYLYSLLPTLRDSLTWFSPFGSFDCLGSSVNVPLTDKQFMWFDCNAFNGFTYYYAVTTFDRGFDPSSGRQGLQKVDNCFVELGRPVDCPEILRPIKLEVNAQNVLRRVYAVPNPFRTGGSRLTRANYHNFPDNRIRFVNVPQNSELRIYTVAGDLVYKTTHRGALGNVEWDGRNLGNEPVTSGVYIYRVQVADGSGVFGRLVIIR